MHVVLGNPPYNDYVGIIGRAWQSIPLNLAYLASSLRLDGHAVEILDAEAQGWGPERFVRELSARQPGVVGFTCTTPAYSMVVYLCRALKQVLPHVKIMLGGPHPIALPTLTLEDCGADAVCLGEGEAVVRELVAAWENGRAPADVPGLVYREGGEFRRTGERATIRSLDSLPFPARDLLDLPRYGPPPTKRITTGQYTSMLSSRGCPFPCTFCSLQTVWRMKVRYRSAANVLAEILEVVARYQVRELNFHDDTFTLNHRRVFELTEELARRDPGVRWSCMARADSVTPELCRALYRAGCRVVSLGLESGDDVLLQRLGKRTTVEQGARAVRTAAAAGLRVSASFMLGAPGETRTSAAATIDFACSLPLDTAKFYCATPYPGTALFDEAVREEYFRPHATWNDFSNFPEDSPLLELPDLPAATVRRLQRRALRRFYFRPRYLIGTLARYRHRTMIDSGFKGLRLLVGVLWTRRRRKPDSGVPLLPFVIERISA